MKSFVVLSALVAITCAAPQFQAKYQPQSPNQEIPIIRQDLDINPDGSYQFSYETGNGIAAQEQGALRNAGPNSEPSIAAQGSFSYSAPDGSPIAITYIADENGFQPQGAHLPTPPPTPEAILRSLQYIASKPQQPQQPQQPFAPAYRG